MRTPFNAPPLSGRKGYREPGEPVDERPVIRHRAFWRDAAEEAAWTTATRTVMAMPEWSELPFWQRLNLICAAAGHAPEVHPERKAERRIKAVRPLSADEYNRRMEALRAQAGTMREPGEDRDQWWDR